MESIVYRQGEKKRKRPKVPRFIENQICNLRSNGFSTGLVIYEVLMMSNNNLFDDRLSKIEHNIDQEISDNLVGVAVREVRQTLNCINTSNKSRTRSELIQKTESDPMEETKLSFMFPQEFETPYGFGNVIEDSTIKYSMSAFEDRLDRIEFKQDLLEFILDKDYNSEHPVSKAIANCNTQEYHIEEARKLIGLDTELEWWEKEDLTIYEIAELEHTANGNGLSQKQQSKRIIALQKAVQNSSIIETESDLRQIIKDVYDVKSEYTIDTYVEQINL